MEAQDDNKLLCNAECKKTIDDIKMINLPSGLQYKEIKEGTGPIPPVGFQVSHVMCNIAPRLCNMRSTVKKITSNLPVYAEIVHDVFRYIHGSVWTFFDCRLLLIMLPWFPMAQFLTTV